MSICEPEVVWLVVAHPRDVRRGRIIVSFESGTDLPKRRPPRAGASVPPRALLIVLLGPLAALMGAAAVADAMTTALMLTSIVILTIAGLIAHWRMLSPLSDTQSAENRDRTLGREAAFGAGSLQRDRQREALEDRMWVLSDQEARYRALLDRQADVISLRDASGRLTFVNEAFCQTFGVTWSNVVGTDFRPREIKAADDATPFVAATRTDVSPPFGRGELMSQVMTEHGPRWFEWRTTTVPGAEVEWDDVQCVGRDVTDARDFATALAQARDAAEAANTAKSRFLASMSHEIRTPLNGIVGLTDGLKRTALDRRQSTYVESLDRSARILKALIDDILNFSKIEAGHIDLR
ncbi:MAG: histidine kinase dimerization/phospho-acceptor domain-containing protein, partial [Pseudomonadota bacterium]